MDVVRPRATKRAYDARREYGGAERSGLVDPVLVGSAHTYDYFLDILAFTLATPPTSKVS